MCLAIPGKVLSIPIPAEGVMKTAIVSFNGITKEINIELVPEAKEGEYVLVHVGVAMSVVDEEEALKTLRFLEGSGEMEDFYN